MPQRGLTYDDLRAFPEDGLRRELIDGELFVTASPYLRHQRILGWLYTVFFNHIEAHGGGQIYVAPADVLLSYSDVVEPDLVFIAEGQLDIQTDANIQGVPSLLVEVLSDARMDRVRKRELYERFGVPEYWIVDPTTDRVEVYRLGGDGYADPRTLKPGDLLAFELLPGLAIDVTKLFDR